MGGRKKLTEEQVLEIVGRLEEDTYQDLADEYGVSIATISKIKKSEVDGLTEVKFDITNHEAFEYMQAEFKSWGDWAKNAIDRLRWMIEFFTRYADNIPAEERDLIILGKIIEMYGVEKA